LSANRDKSYQWGYWHFAIFAALAALGAGLEVAIMLAPTERQLHAQAFITGYCVAIPTAAFMGLLSGDSLAAQGPVSHSSVGDIASGGYGAGDSGERQCDRGCRSGGRNRGCVCAGRRGDGVATRTEAGSKLIDHVSCRVALFGCARKLAQTSSPELRTLALK
jgi:hypothetical protein